ncbi:hypothetical protein MSPP1_001969 [Malassezia sp. CBS 17886]|nr:hypothetical protein MSPP1_001969 [Malassezia sp. CBS 17886]
MRGFAHRRGIYAFGGGANHMSPTKIRQRIVRDAIESSNFKYLHDVKGHRSCVNALAFSRGSGQWLVSGGDDMRIHVRDMFDFDDTRPGPPEASSYQTRARLLGHTSNIFSLSWSAGNQFLYSGGNDQQVLCYDLNYDSVPFSSVKPQAERRMPATTICSHEAGIREVSAHPTNPHLALSSSDCGELFLLDMRLPGTRVAGHGYFPAQLASAQWNPNESDGKTFAAATVCEPNAGVALFDTRRVFGDSEAYLDVDDALVRYASELVSMRDSHTIASRRMETTGAQFDPSGRFLVADVSLFHPVLYAVGQPEPLATFSSLDWHPHHNPCASVDVRHGSEKFTGYRNSCTVKRGSFGFEKQAGALYYVTGSDDFRAYGWQVPPMHDLLAARESLPQNAWMHRDARGEGSVWFRHESACGQPAVVHPVELAAPDFTLEGSRSIVNSALCHPTLPLIATAGIERLIRIHYAMPASLEHTRADWDLRRPETRSRVRAVNTAAVIRAIRRSQRRRLLDDSDSDEGLREEDDGTVQQRPASEAIAESTQPEHAADTGRTATTAELADEEAIALFDELLRAEELRSLFSQNQYLDSSSEESESESMSGVSVGAASEDAASDMLSSAESDMRAVDAESLSEASHGPVSEYGALETRTGDESDMDAVGSSSATSSSGENMHSAPEMGEDSRFE